MDIGNDIERDIRLILILSTILCVVTYPLICWFNDRCKEFEQKYAAKKEFIK